MKPDVIVVHPLHVDYPLFRAQIRKYRDRFNKVLICFSDHHTKYDFSGFIKRAMAPDGVTFIDSSHYSGDWRNHATHRCLQQSVSDSVIFIEQDFFIYNPSFLDTIIGSGVTTSFMEHETTSSAQPGDRLHPAFIFILKKDLEKTSYDFAAKPPLYDHFGFLSQQLFEQNTPINLLEEIGFNTPQDWEHLAFLTHNYILLSHGQQPVGLDRFIQYNIDCLNADVIQCPQFIPIMKKAANL